MNTALITGINGQTGSYLCELLLKNDYKVYGIKRRSSSHNTQRIDHIFDHPNLKLIYGDLSDYSSLSTIIGDIKPELFFNLGAQSISKNSIIPIQTSLGVEHISFEELWNRYAAKNEIIIEKNQNIEVEVINIKNKQLKALGYWNGMGTWFPLQQISRHKFKNNLIKLTQKFGSVEATPNHCIFDINQKLCKPEENPWLLNVRKINYVDRKPNNKINFKLPGKIKSKNLINLECDDSISAFARFIGAFIAEGHTTYNKANNSFFIGISNQDKKWLEQIQNDLKSFYLGTSCFIKHKKINYTDVWELQINSKELFDWLQLHCGKNSDTKQIPSMMLNVHIKHQKQMFDKMIEGDGCYLANNNWRYTTASYKLACQFSFLCTMLGFDYTVNEEKNIKYNKNYYHFRQCNVYQPNQGNTGKVMELVPYDDYVYDISVENVENFAVGVGNIVVHNSHVKVSFDIPEYTMDVTGTGVIRCLEAIRKASPKTKFLQASSSEIFGAAPPPQNEKTIFHPRSPYAVAKIAGYYATINYREAYGIHASNSIAFNHESPRRAETFVTRKITRAATRIKLGLQDKLYLGNLGAKRDWAHASDIADAMFKIINTPEPDDYVIATGEMHSVKEFAQTVFNKLNLNYEDYIIIDPKYFRPAEVDALCGDPTKIKKILGWEPKYTFEQLIDEMVDSDMKLAKQEKILKDNDKNF